MLVSYTYLPPVQRGPGQVWSGLQEPSDLHETSIQKWAQGGASSSDELVGRVVWFLEAMIAEFLVSSLIKSPCKLFQGPEGRGNSAFSGEAPQGDEILLIILCIDLCHQNFQQKFSGTVLTPVSLASRRLCRHLTLCNKSSFYWNQAECIPSTTRLESCTEGLPEPVTHSYSSTLRLSWGYE